MNRKLLSKYCSLFIVIISLSFNITSYSNSRLASGDWYKFRVGKSGVYKITYKQLKNIGFQDINNVKIYGYGGEQLPYSNGESRPEGMAEIPIKIVDGDDETFNDGDYIICYLEGPVVWKYSTSTGLFKHKIHEYSDYIYYFIYCNSATRNEPQIENAGLSGNVIFSTGTYYDYFEENLINGLASGRTWYGEAFDDDGFEKSFTISNFDTDNTINYKVAAVGRNGSTEQIQFFINNELVQTSSVSSVNVDDGNGNFGNAVSCSNSTKISGNTITFGLDYTGTDASDKAYLDYIYFNTTVDLTYSDESYYLFRNPDAANTDIVSFSIADLPSDAVIWDITDINNIRELNTSTQGDNLVFSDSGKTVKEYLAFFLDEDYPSPNLSSDNDDIGFIENQNLHGLSSTNMLIITHPSFLDAAEELADLHREEDDLSVTVTTTEIIYNEFSSGIRDVSALRDFIKYLYENVENEDDSLKYVLLFGDGSYNNKEDVSGNTNYIPTYQSVESLITTTSYVSDDFFGFLEEDEGGNSTISSSTLDVGVGRLPVAEDSYGEDSEAWDMVDKIKTYYEKENLADWSLRIAFLADDAESSWELGFMTSSETMADLILANKPEFNIEKLYCDAYEQVTTSTGQSYPDVQEAVVKALEKGVLVLNYMGHGNENSMTEEKVLQLQDIESLENAPYFPLIITASCQVGRYDQVTEEDGVVTAIESIGEAAVLNTLGGAIASFTTTRVVYQHANATLNENVYKQLFKKDDNGHYGRLGDIIKRSKNATGSGTNKLNFTLLGDPAIKFPIPEELVLIDSVNSTDISKEQDTLKAFQEVTITGRVTDIDSNIYSSFNGVVNINVFDKEVEMSTRSNDGMDTLTYMDQKNVIYKGKATVENGRFSTKFRVPKDISYNYGKGKIAVFAQDSSTIASGYSKNIIIGGTADNNFTDNSGPDIDLFLNDTNFVDGSICGPSPYIYAKVYDESGINTTGLGIGHDITAYIYENDKKYYISEFFESDLDDYRKGIVNYQIKNLDEGNYNLTLKVWDINNNSSEAYISFEVVGEDQLLISELQNYPNPATTYTEFHYNHNMPETDHNVTIDIFDLSGRLVQQIKRSNYEQGFVAEPVPWNISATNLAGGVYPYRLTISTSDGKTSYFNQKLIIIK